MNKLISKKENKLRWIYQFPQEIYDLMIQENKSQESFDDQLSYFLQKLNFCMINFLSLHCREFKIVIKQFHQNEFIDITSISKYGEVYYNGDDVIQLSERLETYDIDSFRRQLQMKTLASLINKNCGISFTFTDDENNFQLLNYHDSKKVYKTVTDFIKNFDSYQQMINSIILRQQQLNQMYSHQIHQQVERQLHQILDNAKPTDPFLYYPQQDNVNDTTPSDKNEQKENQQNKSSQSINNKWKFQNNDEIEEILKEENILRQSHQAQQAMITRKMNISMIYLILSQCPFYTLVSKKPVTQDYFTYIEKITKGDEIVYDMNTINSTNKYSQTQISFERMKKQMEIFSTIIEKEFKIKIRFCETHGFPELQTLVDQNNQQIKLAEFFEKYCQVYAINSIFREQNGDKSGKWQFQNSKEIFELLKVEKALNKTREEQTQFVISTMNCCMIYILTHLVKGYLFELERIDENNFIFIQRISVNNFPLYNSMKLMKTYRNSHSNATKEDEHIYQRKAQLKKLASMMQKDIGITINFGEKSSMFQLLKLINNVNGEQMNLIDFVCKYNKFDELMNYFKQQENDDETEEDNVENNLEKTENQQNIENNENVANVETNDKINENNQNDDTDETEDNFPLNYLQKRFDNNSDTDEVVE